MHQANIEKMYLSFSLQPSKNSKKKNRKPEGKRIALQIPHALNSDMDPFHVHTNALFSGAQRLNDMASEVDGESFGESCLLAFKLKVSFLSEHRQL